MWGISQNGVWWRDFIFSIAASLIWSGGMSLTNAEGCFYVILLKHLSLILSCWGALQYVCSTGTPSPAGNLRLRMMNDGLKNAKRVRKYWLKTWQDSQWKRKNTMGNKGKECVKGMQWLRREWGRQKGEEDRLDVAQYKKMSGEGTPEGRAERNRLSC